MKKVSVHKKQFLFLYGIEHDGIILPDLCLGQILDFNASGVFEHKSDAYYNCWPHPKKEDGFGWKNTNRGIHTTTDISDIELLLGSEIKEGQKHNVILTNRCVEHLVSLDYTVHLLRSRTIEIRNVVSVRITHSKFGKLEQVFEDKTDTKIFGVGKYKIE